MRRNEKVLDNIDLSLQENVYLNLSLEDLPFETWKPMAGNNKFYRVSNLGRIKKESNTGTPKIIEQSPCREKNHILRFMVNRDWLETAYVVAATYKTPNLLKMPLIGHTNGIKTDNRPDNLEYCEANSDDMVAAYVMCDWAKIKGLSAARTPVVKVSIYGERISAYDSIEDASRKTGMTFNEIHGIVKYKSIVGGCYWMQLHEYFKQPNVKFQCHQITKKHKATHPWLHF